jgi:hypothetical protein
MYCCCRHNTIGFGKKGTTNCPTCGKKKKRRKRTAPYPTETKVEDDFSFKNPLYKKKYLNYEAPVKRLKFASESGLTEKFTTINPKNIAAITQALAPQTDLLGAMKETNVDDRIDRLTQQLNNPARYSQTQIKEMEKELEKLLDQKLGPAKPSVISGPQYTPEEMFNVQKQKIKDSFGEKIRESVVDDLEIKNVDRNVLVELVNDYADAFRAYITDPTKVSTISQYEALLTQMLDGYRVFDFTINALGLPDDDAKREQVIEKMNEDITAYYNTVQELQTGVRSAESRLSGISPPASPPSGPRPGPQPGPVGSTLPTAEEIKRTYRTRRIQLANEILNRAKAELNPSELNWKIDDKALDQLTDYIFKDQLDDKIQNIIDNTPQENWDGLIDNAVQIFRFNNTFPITTYLSQFEGYQKDEQAFLKLLGEMIKKNPPTDLVTLLDAVNAASAIIASQKPEEKKTEEKKQEEKKTLDFENYFMTETGNSGRSIVPFDPATADRFVGNKYVQNVGKNLPREFEWFIYRQSAKSGGELRFVTGPITVGKGKINETYHGAIAWPGGGITRVPLSGQVGRELALHFRQQGPQSLFQRIKSLGRRGSQP